MLSHPRWCSIFHSGSFTILGAFACTVGLAKPSPGSVSTPVKTHLWPPSATSINLTCQLHQGLLTWESATWPPAVSVSIAGRQKTFYWHFVPQRVQWGCVNVQPISALLQCHVHWFHRPRWPLQGSTLEYLLGDSNLLSKGSSDGINTSHLIAPLQLPQGHAPHVQAYFLSRPGFHALLWGHITRPLATALEPVKPKHRGFFTAVQLFHHC